MTDEPAVQLHDDPAPMKPQPQSEAPLDTRSLDMGHMEFDPPPKPEGDTGATGSTGPVDPDHLAAIENYVRPPLGATGENRYTTYGSTGGTGDFHSLFGATGDFHSGTGATGDTGATGRAPDPAAKSTREMPAIRFVQSPNQSERQPHGVRITAIVVHSCQGNADGAVAWFSTRASQVSAHIVVPETGDFVYQCVPLGMKAWHCCAANSYTIGVEMGGFAEKGFADGELDLAALTIGWLLKAYGLPCVFLADGVGEGWTTHYRLGAMGGGHTDFTTDPEVENAFAERVHAAFESFGDGPLPAFALHGAPSPHAVSLPPPMPDGWSPTVKTLKEEDDNPSGGPVSGYPPGSIGDIQYRLRMVGANPQLVVDGLDGPATESAIEVFERSTGLPVTKTINPATWTRLEEMTAPQPVAKPAPFIPAVTRSTPAPFLEQPQGSAPMSVSSTIDNIITVALGTISDVESLSPEIKAAYNKVKSFESNPALLDIVGAWNKLFTHTVTAGAGVVVEPVSATPGKATPEKA